MNKLLTLFLFFLILVFPLLYITIYEIVNSLEYIISYTGHISLMILGIVLLCSRVEFLNSYFDRKYLGLIAFFFVCIHLLVYLYELDFNFIYILDEMFSLRFLLFGYIALILFLPLVVTSNKYSKKILGNYWFILHKLIYIIIFSSLIHYYLSIKIAMIWLWFYIIAFTILFINFYNIKKNE